MVKPTKQTNIGLRQYFDYIISVEYVKKYKPSPEPYDPASKRLGISIFHICCCGILVWTSGWNADMLDKQR
jgi:FMN phosphatase YigB (HAD superfamily)